MNEDHASAVVLYAQAFGGKPEATEAQMLAIDANGMDLTAQVNGETLPVRVNFDRTFHACEDCSPTLLLNVN
jgi:putative heme iron utilization protein